MEKEQGFGNFRFNQSLLGDHVPAMFENGERHRQQKSFLIAVSQNMLRMGRLIPNIMDIMPEHLIKWNFKEGMQCVLSTISCVSHPICLYGINSGSSFKMERSREMVTLRKCIAVVK